VITSPGFPNDYPANSNISWLIQVPKGKFIEVNFLSFETEEDCWRDSLTIYNGPSDASPVIGEQGWSLWFEWAAVGRPLRQAFSSLQTTEIATFKKSGSYSTIEFPSIIAILTIEKSADEKIQLFCLPIE
jgi:hypothetical protein